VLPDGAGLTHTECLIESDAASGPASHSSPSPRPIGQFLVERGLLTPAELEQALTQQRQSGKRLGEILVERGAITRLELAGVLSEQWHEAGSQLRAVAPVRAAGRREADGLAGSEQLTASPSLHAAVARLEELALALAPASGAAVSHREADALARVEAALGSLRVEVAELRVAIAALPTGESERDGQLHARLDELPELVARLVSERLEERLAGIERAFAPAPATLFGELRIPLEGLVGTVADLAAVEEENSTGANRQLPVRLEGPERTAREIAAARGERLSIFVDGIARLDEHAEGLRERLAARQETVQRDDKPEPLRVEADASSTDLESLGVAATTEGDDQAVAAQLKALPAELHRPGDDLAGRTGGIEHVISDSHRRLEALQAALEPTAAEDSAGRLEQALGTPRLDEARIAILAERGDGTGELAQQLRVERPPFSERRPPSSPNAAMPRM
jgi:hypothetical protein